MLSKFLPKCEANNLYQTVLDLGEWALQYANHEESIIINKLFSLSKSYYAKHEIQLDIVPSTCVHGDFWSGNIAVSNEVIKFIDWADTMWGVGGISIINLILNEKLPTDESHHIWDSYFKGLEITKNEDFILSCEIAHIISELIVYKEIYEVEDKESCNGMRYYFDILYNRLNSKVID